MKKSSSSSLIFFVIFLLSSHVMAADAQSLEEAVAPLAADKERQTPVKTFLFLGNSGVGKSYLTEELTGERDLSGGGSEPVTKFVTAYGIGDSCVIDTPALSGNHEDTFLKNFSMISEKILGIQKCLPVIVVNGGDRFTDAWIQTIKIIGRYFTLEIRDYVLIINKTFGRMNTDELVDKVEALIGKAPLKVINVLFNGNLDFNQFPEF